MFSFYIFYRQGRLGCCDICQTVKLSDTTQDILDCDHGHLGN